MARNKNFCIGGKIFKDTRQQYYYEATYYFQNQSRKTFKFKVKGHEIGSADLDL